MFGYDIETIVRILKDNIIYNGIILNIYFSNINYEKIKISNNI